MIHARYHGPRVRTVFTTERLEGHSGLAEVTGQIWRRFTVLHSFNNTWEVSGSLVDNTRIRINENEEEPRTNRDKEEEEEEVDVTHAHDQASTKRIELENIFSIECEKT